MLLNSFLKVFLKEFKFNWDKFLFISSPFRIEVFSSLVVWIMLVFAVVFETRFP